MNPSMVWSSPSYNAPASTKDPLTEEYHITSWATRRGILDGGTVRRFLGTAGADRTGKVVSRAKWSLSKDLTRKVSAVYDGILTKAT